MGNMRGETWQERLKKKPTKYILVLPLIPKYTLMHNQHLLCLEINTIVLVLIKSNTP